MTLVRENRERGEDPVREQWRVAADERVRLLTRAVLEAEARTQRALTRAKRAENKLRGSRRVVREGDAHALQRARAKAADEHAAHQATGDQLVVALRDRDAARRELASLLRELEQLREAVRATEREAQDVSDRVAAGEAELRQLREETRSLSISAVESKAVSAAEVRAHEAELRAAAAERKMREQAATVCGELRRLTDEEIAELREKGPAGPMVLTRALKRLAAARARGSRVELHAALGELARAAINWRERM